MRGSVVTHGGLSNVEVHHGVDLVANADRLLGGDLMSPYTLDGVVASLHVGDDILSILKPKIVDMRFLRPSRGQITSGQSQPSAVADLAAGLGVERRVVEDDLAFLAGFQLLWALAVVDDSQDFAAVGACLAVALEFGLWKLL